MYNKENFKNENKKVCGGEKDVGGGSGQNTRGQTGQGRLDEEGRP